MDLGEMRPGSLSQQYNVCGKPGCRCKDPKNPQRHGPYYQLSYVHQGKSTTQFIRPELRATVRTQIATFKKFRKLTDRWVDLALTPLPNSNSTPPDGTLHSQGKISRELFTLQS